MLKDKLAKPVSGVHGEALRQLLIKNRQRHSALPINNQAQHLQSLMHWQTSRLKHTHADLFASERYQQAAHYFVDDLYLSPNAIQRDRDLERVFPTLVKLLPDETLETVAKAVELNILSAELDQQLADKLFQLNLNHGQEDLNQEITEEKYIQAYQACNAGELRTHQLNLIKQIGHDLDHLVRIPLISWTLKLIRKPAHKKGLGNLHDFLERGFSTFKALGGANEFMNIISFREGQIITNLNSGQQSPFSIDLHIDRES
ncbi:FFLEELY motif protein [Litoribacillus peritrichatus]|uniref:DUF8198 domain-containing protein n=1 Tax=Litoribacillus peritrichatus TaxID=718191 RepID=A0ABP7MT04_9GAMM